MSTSADARPPSLVDVTRRARLIVAHRLVTSCLAVYLVMRVISAFVLLWVAHHQDPGGIPNGPSNPPHVSYGDVTRMWDGEWYRRIATDGYPHHVPRDGAGQVRQNPLAFYPLFPMLVRLGMSATGAGFAPVGATLALGLGCAAVAVMARLLEPRIGGPATLAAVAVFASSPPSPTLQMAYTESLGMLLLCSVLLALERHQWWAAAALALTVGIARPIGVPLALVGLVAVVLRWRSRRDDPIGRREGAGMFAALVTCGLSGVIWMLVTAWMTGESDAYTATMGSWRATHEVVPFEAWWRVGHVLMPGVLVPLALVAIVVAMTALVAGPWSHRLGPIMRAWCAAYAFYLFATLEPWSSTFRYLLMFFPLAASLVGGAWRRGPSWLMPWLTIGLVAFNLVAQMYWASHYLLFTPPLGNPP